MSDPAACCVLLCPSSEQSRSLRSVCFFDFPHPTDPRYPLWIERTLRPKDWTPSPTSKICSKHFRSTDILTLRHADGSGRAEKRLKYDALPSVFEGIPDSMRPQTHVVPRADSPEIVPTTNCSKKRSADCLDENLCNEAQKESSDSLNASIEEAEVSTKAQSNFSHPNDDPSSVSATGPLCPSASIPRAKKARHDFSPVVFQSNPTQLRSTCSLAYKIAGGQLTVLENCAQHVSVDYPAATDADEARKCCVPGCSNGRDDNLQGRIHFHAFPTDKRFQTEWIKRVAFSSFWQPAPYSVVCSVHFLNTDYGFIGRILCLKPTAIPSQLGCRNGLMRKLNGPCPFSRMCAICGCWRGSSRPPTTSPRPGWPLFRFQKKGMND
ncbi:uncharacterized protein LOC129585500 [Paramacrobiotus metropolitanus]|uniref:uncharacterized protein LOC129585500 n=1 Tax=Paramacrobiotus metropolitanus TaxID=2943436 RepID=UPI002446480B|nr:uncharacterized protein LOC129585500 [Paramacrobiotus metropolitanus]